MKYVFALSLLVSGLRAADAVPVQTGVVVQAKNADLVAQVMAFLAQNGVTCQNQAQAFLALNTASDSTDAAIQQSFADFLNCSQAAVFVTPAQAQDILAAANDAVTVTTPVALEQAGAILAVANDAATRIIADAAVPVVLVLAADVQPLATADAVATPSDVTVQDAILVAPVTTVTSTDLEVAAAAAGVVGANVSDSLLQQVTATLNGTN